MPYGALGTDTLSKASRLCVEKALDWWQKSMVSTKHKTYLVVSGYDNDGGRELVLRRKIIAAALQNSEFAANVIEVSADNEVRLAQKLSRVRELLPVETITVFTESRNAVSVKAIFKRKFGKTLQIRTFKADFEPDHEWITTSTALAWWSRNWLVRLWFGTKRRLGRGVRKKIRYWFKS